MLLAERVSFRIQVQDMELFMAVFVSCNAEVGLPVVVIRNLQGPSHFK